MHQNMIEQGCLQEIRAVRPAVQNVMSQKTPDRLSNRKGWIFQSIPPLNREMISPSNCGPWNDLLLVSSLSLVWDGKDNWFCDFRGSYQEKRAKKVNLNRFERCRCFRTTTSSLGKSPAVHILHNACYLTAQFTLLHSAWNTGMLRLKRKGKISMWEPPTREFSWIRWRYFVQ